MLTNYIEHKFEDPCLENIDPRMILDYVHALETNPVYKEAVRAVAELALNLLQAEPYAGGFEGVLERNNALLASKKLLAIHDTVCSIRENAEELLADDNQKPKQENE